MKKTAYVLMASLALAGLCISRPAPAQASFGMTCNGEESYGIMEGGIMYYECSSPDGGSYNCFYDMVDDVSYCGD